jgi:hypothetical protein
LSHRIAKLDFGEDSEELRDMKSRVSQHQHAHDGWSPLQGTVAIMPQIIGNMQVGFYSAYFTDVTPITLIDLEGNKRHTL